MARRRDLRLVGHAQDLAGFAERAQLGADRRGNRAADAGIDLVEDHARHLVQAQRGDLDRQRDARQLAARGDLAQRARRLAGVGGHQEIRALGAIGVRRLRVGHGVQRDFETPATHAEFADQGVDGPAQGIAGLAAGGAEFVRGVVPGGQRDRDVAVEDAQARIGIRQRFQFGRQRIAMRGEPIRSDAVLACEVLHADQPAFDVVQRFRVDIQVVADAFQQGDGFVQLDRRGFQHRIHLAQPRLVGGLALQAGAQLLQLRGDRLVAAQPLQGLLAGGDQRCRMRMPAMVGIQRGQRGRFERFRLQFVQLVRKPGAAFADIAAGEQGIAFVAQRAPALRGFAHRSEQARMPGVGVEQAGLGAARQQGLLLVLAVDFDQ